MKRVGGLLLAVPFFFLAHAQEPGDERPQRTSAVYEEIAKAPEKARAKRNPFAKDPGATEAGRILFEQRCAECHGTAAEGGKKGPSLRAAEVQNAEPGAIFWILTNGVVRKGMPVWSKLPEPQRWQLVVYIKSLGMAAAKPQALPPATFGTPKDSPWPRR